MADYRIWGRIHRHAAGELISIAYAIPLDTQAPALIEHSRSHSRPHAERELERLMIELGAKVCELGHRVVEVR
jgi:hypothetical protein